jgi:thiol:disulfide interchange protein DsbC
MLKSLLVALTLLSNNVLADKNDIIEGLIGYVSNVAEEDINPTPFQGLYEVVIRKPRLDVIYISEDGRYLAQGEVIDLKTRMNLTQNRLSSLAKEILSTTTDDEKIIYKAKDEKYTIDIFTDVDCPYCRKLHKDVAVLNKMGITIKYLAFPRSGVNTKSYYRSMAIWCADNQKQAMDRGMLKKDNPSANCENPIIDHLILASRLNVTGTPFMFFENGDNMPGYVKPKELLKAIKRSLAKYQ